MRKIKNALMVGAAMLTLVGAALSATPAYALDTLGTTNRGWEINTDSKGTCSARRDHTDGTRTAIILTRNGDWLFLIGDRSWGDNIVEGNTYQISLVIDGYRWGSKEWVGRNNGNGSYVALQANERFLRSWANGYRMELYSNGKYLTALWLDGTMDAILQVINCHDGR